MLLLSNTHGEDEVEEKQKARKAKKAKSHKVPKSLQRRSKQISNEELQDLKLLQKPGHCPACKPMFGQ